jgi:hypothetical protein
LANWPGRSRFEVLGNSPAMVIMSCGFNQPAPRLVAFYGESHNLVSSISSKQLYYFVSWSLASAFHGDRSRCRANRSARKKMARDKPSPSNRLLLYRSFPSKHNALRSGKNRRTERHAADWPAR